MPPQKINYVSGPSDEYRVHSLGPHIDIASLAMHDPVLAFALARTPNKTPQIYTIRAQFTTGAVDETVTGSTGSDNDNGFCSDFLVLSAKFQVRRINAFAGSIFQAQANVNNALNSGIDAELKVFGDCPNFFINEDPIPLEFLADAPGTPDNGCGFPYGFVAPKCGRIHATFTNRAPFAGATNPVEVFLAFRGIALGCGITSIELPFAQAELARMGIGSGRVIVSD